MTDEDIQLYIDKLDEYEIDPELMLFDLVHLYPQDLCRDKGYHDSRFFQLVGYNFELKSKRDLGNHDGLAFENNALIDIVRIYVDGSTLIRFVKPVYIIGFQVAHVIGR